MVEGLERYLKIEKWLRDEEKSEERMKGELYKIEIEMRLVKKEEVWEKMEKVMRGIFEEFEEGKKVKKVLRRIDYEEEIRKYG